MVYWIEFSYTEENQQVDGIARVPGMMEVEKAEKLLKTGAAWKLPKEIAQENEKQYQEIERMEQEEES